MTFALRYLEQGDLEWLRRLRNVSSENFFTTTQISPADQQAWFVAQPWGDERWIVLDEDTPVGYFSIETPRPDLPIFPTRKLVRYLNALLVDPAHRGRGVIQTASVALDPLNTYVGYVRKGNESSLRACAKLGLADRGLYEHPKIGPIHLVWKD